LASTIDNRLSRLNVRRRGLDRVQRLDEASRIEVLAKALATEDYQRRASNRPHTRYALGAMQEVDADYTRIGLEEAVRVGRQLETGLSKAGIEVGFEVQGSVPLNVHIRGVSDVDLLTLDEGFFTYDPAGSRALAGWFGSPIAYTPLSALQRLRREAETTLRNAFPKADVDCAGSKAIKVSGGSLRRPVDVVPSHWHDTATYQASGQKHDRGVKILDKSTATTPLNLPFLHIKRVHDRDGACLGGLKKAIRLCKNVKADAAEDGKQIALPSFDIAATMYHADLPSLTASAGYELAVLAETQRHLDRLARDHEHARSLMVPDGGRRVFDTAEKHRALVSLSLEMDELARQVAAEQAPTLRGGLAGLSVVEDALRKSYVPA
jgi:hypothetical protein